MVVVPRRGRVGRAIALATGLDPDEGVLERIAGVGRGPDAEARADDVAPVAPLALLGGLDAIAGCTLPLD